MRQHISAADQQLNNLIAFRQVAYHALGRARDALFELTDSLLLSPRLPSLAHLSCAAVFRRRWSSVYAALQDGNPDRSALLGLYLRHVAPTATSLVQPRLILAADHTSWPMPHARTMPERGYWHQPLPLAIGRPITVGHGYATLVWVPQTKGSWALPLLHERVPIGQKPLQKTAAQLRSVVEQLPQAMVPLVLCDSGHGNASFLLETKDIRADKIIRLRPNLRLYRAPPPYSGKGAPRKHGTAFKFKEPASWGEPEELLRTTDSRGQQVEVALWRKLHFAKAAEQHFDVVRISRPAARSAGVEAKPQWLIWVDHQSKPAPAIRQWWWLYGRRFPVDHWYRLAKGQMQWLLPQVSTPERCETWSQLLPLATWQLWLARSLVGDGRLPWQKQQRAEELTPGRVRQGLGGVMAQIGTPAKAPKVRGKSEGWPAGKQRRRRGEQKVIHKGTPRRPKGTPKLPKGGKTSKEAAKVPT